MVKGKIIQLFRNMIMSALSGEESNNLVILPLQMSAHCVEM